MSIPSEREACAKVVEALAENMGEIALHLGELSAQERRTCRAVLKLVAHKIRTRTHSGYTAPREAK